MGKAILLTVLVMLIVGLVAVNSVMQEVMREVFL